MRWELILLLIAILAIVAFLIFRHWWSYVHYGDEFVKEILDSKQGNNITDESKLHASGNDDSKDDVVESDVAKSTDRNEMDEDRFGNKQLALDCLRRLGCSPEVQNDGNIRFLFQGDQFVMLFNNSFIRIWHLPFFKLDDGNVSVNAVLKIINKVNMEIGPNLFLRNVDSSKVVDSKWDVIFIPSIPEPAEFLSMVLNQFLKYKTEFYLEVEKLIQQNEISGRESLSSIKPSQN